MKKVLIVEDESLVAMEIAETVAAHGFAVVGTCADGNCAIETAKMQQPELILMDIRLKGEMDGIKTAERILEYCNSLLIFLTAFSDKYHIERAVALNPLGYLIKPIRKAELHALLNMAELHRNDTLEGDLILDTHFSIESKTALLIKDGYYVSLTKKERQLLRLLIENKNGVVSFYEMELAIWPDKIPNDSTRRSLVNRLRAKMDNRFLETIHAEGYRLLSTTADL